MNSSDEMYGEERLLETVNSTEYESISELQNKIKQNVKEFTKDFPQSDDMTMLICKFNGNSKATYHDIATKDNYKKYLEWLTETANNYELGSAVKYKLELISEEIYTNIISYAYPKGEGYVDVSLQKQDKELTIVFTDSGVPFNPLDKPDPDIDFPPESREQGGLGIFIVKNMTSYINYEYLGGRNVLTMKVTI